MSGRPNLLRNEEAVKKRPKLDGLKKFLHGIAYQHKLYMYFYLVNAKQSINPRESSTEIKYKVFAEDPTTGIFNDILYILKDGDKTIEFFIQAKHKHDRNVIKLKKFTNPHEKSFFIEDYFESFLNTDKLQARGMASLILCTNCNIDENALSLWTKVDSAAVDDTTSRDSYILKLFEKLEGKCYRLDYNNLRNEWSPEKTSDKTYLFDRMKKIASKKIKEECTKLVEVIINAIESGTKIDKISRETQYAMKYRSAVMSIILKENCTANESYSFSKEFLSCSITKPGYEAFKKQFEIQYKKVFKTRQDVWDDLKEKRVIVAEDFWSDEEDIFASSDSFPDTEESIKSFCEKFRLYCGANELDDKLSYLMENIFYDKRCSELEISLILAKLSEMLANQLQMASYQPKENIDVKRDLELLINSISHIKWSFISNIRYHNITYESIGLSSNQMHIDKRHLSSIYDKHFSGKTLLILNEYDINFILKILSSISKQKGKEALFLSSFDVMEYSDDIKNHFHFSEDYGFLAIICEDKFDEVHNIIKTWGPCTSNVEKQMILIKQLASQNHDLDNGKSFSKLLYMNHLEEESWKRFINTNIPRCANTIPKETIENFFKNARINEVMELLKQQEKIEEGHNIVKNYEQIKDIFVHRSCINEKEKKNSPQENSSVERENLCVILQTIRKRKAEFISIEAVSKRIADNEMIYLTFNKKDKKGDQSVLNIEEAGQKVLILLGEAGCGKSTYMTWLAWHLRMENPSSLVIRCNCTDFIHIMRDEKNINENEALRMLYKMFLLSLDEISGADCASECLNIFNGIAYFDPQKFGPQSLKNRFLLLIFKEKFNDGKMVILFDEFDEIVTKCQEVVLNLLTKFANFIGVSKLYLSSRPYFRTHFKMAFENPGFCELKPLSLQDKGSLLNKLMNSHSVMTEISVGGEIDVPKFDIGKVLSVILIYSLKELSDNPLNLIISEKIISDLFKRKAVSTLSKSF